MTMLCFYFLLQSISVAHEASAQEGQTEVNPPPQGSMFSYIGKLHQFISGGELSFGGGDEVRPFDLRVWLTLAEEMKKIFVCKPEILFLFSCLSKGFQNLRMYGLPYIGQ